MALQNPLISIITVTLNAESVIEECLLSVINQDYTNKEHWVIDGCSVDKTLEIVKDYTSKYSHIKLISEKDNGIYDAMNKGINLSKGKWLFFLGADDKLYDNSVLSSIFNNTNTLFWDVIYGNVIFSSNNHIYEGNFDTQKILIKNICHQSIFYKRKVFRIMGNFDIHYKYLADYAFNIKWFSSLIIKRKYINRIIAIYNDNGISSIYEDENFSNSKSGLIEKYFYWYFKLTKLKRLIYNLVTHFSYNLFSKS